MVSVKNIKISVKVKTICLKNTIKKLNSQNIGVNVYLNYITFKNKYSYVIFKTSKCGTNHVNVTKIEDFSHINESLTVLQRCCGVTVLSHKVDNIIATYSGLNTINLPDLVIKNVFNCTKYNPERFPGLFVKCEDGTVIIFHSGKLVIVGCKTLNEIWHLFNYVVMKLQS